MRQHLKERISKHQQFTNERIYKRLARKAEKPDMWSFVEDKVGKKEDALHKNEIASTAANFMVAGTETTATTLAGLLYLFSKNPDKKKRLQDEVCNTFSSTEEMTLQKLARLPYLNACIEIGTAVLSTSRQRPSEASRRGQCPSLWSISSKGRK